MDEDDLNEMPEWKSHKLGDDEGEEWKQTLPNSTRGRAKVLYNQGRNIYFLVKTFCETLKGEMAEDTGRLIMQNAMMICPKIIGAEAGDMYVLRMENASIIRTNCRELMTQVTFAGLSDSCEESYEKIIKEEMDEFRKLFIDWAASFKKDEFDDEWGLY